MRSVGFDRDEPPRGERECGGRLRPSPDWGLKVLGVGGEVLRQGLKPGRAGTPPAARCEARKPARRAAKGAPGEGFRPAMTQPAAPKH